MEKQEFQDKIETIADLLGGYWVAFPEESYNNQATLTKDNITINIQNSGYQKENKISISGSYPHDCHGGISYHDLRNPSIGCSKDKTAEQIARDIQKRFLPAYLEDLQKVLTTNKKTQEYADANYQTINTLADLLGITPEKDHRNEYFLRVYNTLQGLHGLEVNYYGSRVDMKLELTPGQAVEVLTLLKTFEKVEV